MSTASGSRRQRAAKTGTADPPTGSRQLAVPRKLRRAAGRLLVASAPVRDLLLRAKHLFDAAMVCLGWEVI